MKLLVWNIQQGGGPRRRPRILESIETHNPDMLAFIEFIPSTAGLLLQSLKNQGFDYVLCTHRNAFNYALCVLSKTSITSGPSGIPILDESGLWLEVHAPGHGLKLGVVHAPTSPRQRMRDFLSAIVEAASRNVDESFLIVGDLNTGIGPADGPLKNFGDVDRFIAIQNVGFTDVWRYFHADKIEHTWCRNGSSYRIDHALTSATLLPRIQDCRYSHSERECRVSDYSILLVEVNG